MKMTPKIKTGLRAQKPSRWRLWLLIPCLLVMASPTLFAQNMSINNSGAAPDSSAMLDVSSTTQGFLMPRMTQAERLAITNPAGGLLVIQTDGSIGLYMYNPTGSGAWEHILDSMQVMSLINSLGAAPLDSVLGVGNDAGGDSIFNLAALSIGSENNMGDLGIYDSVGSAILNMGTKGDGTSDNAVIHMFTQATDPFAIDASNKLWTISARGNSFSSTQQQNDLVFANWNGSAWKQSMLLDTNGSIGIGTSSPSSSLHLYRSDGSASMTIEETSSTVSARTLLDLTNNGVPRMHLIDTDKNTTWRIRGGNVFGFSYVGSSNPEMALDTFGRVGIGVIPSIHKLEVDGNVQADSLYIYDGTNAPTAGDVLTAFGTDGRAYWTDPSSVSGWTQNGNDLYNNIDSIGIGTSDPQYPLHIQSNFDPQVLIEPLSSTAQDGEMTIRGHRNASASSDHASIFFENYDNDLGASNILGKIAGRVTDHSTNVGDLAFYNSSDGSALSETMRLTSGGRVGIGTSSPSAEFEVVGSAQIGIIRSSSSYAALDIYAATEDAAFRFADGSGNLNGGLRWDPTTSANHLFIFGNSSAAALYQDTLGYHSINTPPNQNNTLHVNRTASTADQYGPGKSTIYGYRGGVTGAANGGSSWAQTGVDAAIKGYNLWGNRYTAGVAGYNYNDFDSSAGVIGSDAFANYWAALGYNDGTNTWGMFTPSNTYIGGSLGINQTSPASKLHITTTDNTGDITLDDTYPFLFLNTTTANNGGILFQDNGTYDFIAFYNASLTEFYLDHYSTSGTDFTIASSGYVGLNQPDPTVPLQVDGGSDASLADGSGYFMTNDEGALNVLIDENEIMARNNGAESPLYLQSEGGDLIIHNGQGGTTYVVVQDDGDVGIGGSAPQASLDVHDIAVIGNISVGVESNDQAASGQTGDGFLTTPWIYTNAVQASNERGSGSCMITVGNLAGYGFSDEIHFVTSGNDQMTIESDGQVGIGVGVNPNAMLTLQDDGGDLNSGLQLANSSSDDWYMYQNLSAELVFRDDGADRVVITTAGDLRPASDNARDLGTSSFRWNEVRAGNGTIQTSDIRFKKNIHNLNYGLNEVLTLRPVRYQWKEDSIGEQKIGFVAQEVMDIIPEVVDVGEDSLQTLGMRYGDMIPVLVKAIQEQQMQINTLTNTNEDMQQRLDELNAMLEEYMKSNGTDPEELKASTKSTAEGK